MRKFSNMLLIGLFLVVFSGCKKDESPALADALIEFQNLGPITSDVSSLYPVYAASFAVTPIAMLNITVNYAGVNNAPNDIAVKVGLDLSIIDMYNAKIVANARAAAITLGQNPDVAEISVQNQLYEALDPSLYSLGSLDLTIPSGQRTATFAIALAPNQFSFAKRTALSFKILSASTGAISENFGSIIVAIGAKNRIDGVYTYTSGPTQSLNPNAIENGAELVTSGPNTVTISLVNFYSNRVTYSVNPTTNKVTVLESGNIGDAITDPSSIYDPATKVLHVKWNTPNRTFDETFTYTGSRD